MNERSRTPGPVVSDREGVAHCFGCGPDNADGLRLRFETTADGSVEARAQVAAHFVGFDGVVHGGIQATILDEVMGVAAQLALPTGADSMACLTAELALRFIRPVPIDAEVIARAKVVHTHGYDFYVHGAIVAADGAELTTARSRWRQARR